MDDLLLIHGVMAPLAQITLYRSNLEYIGGGFLMTIITVSHVGLGVVSVTLLFANEYLDRFTIYPRRRKGDLVASIG